MAKAFTPIVPVTSPLPEALKNPDLACNEEPDSFRPIQPEEYSVAAWFERRDAAAELCAHCPLLQACMNDALSRDLPYVQNYNRQKIKHGDTANSARPKFPKVFFTSRNPNIRAGFTMMERQRMLEKSIGEKKAVFPSYISPLLKGAARTAMKRLKLFEAEDVS